MALSHGASGQVIALAANAAPGEITLFGLSGTLTLELRDRTLRVGAGDFVRLARGVPHAVHSADGASALLSLCLHREPPSRNEIPNRHTGLRPPMCAPASGAAEAPSDRLTQQKEQACI